jgi:hypothetical protein
MAETAQKQGEHRGAGTGFEPTEANTRFIALFGAATLLGLVVIILALQAYVDRSEQQQIFQKVLEPVSEDLRNLRAREDAQLHSFQYVDRAKGAVRIPVERAIELLEKEYAEGRVEYPMRPVPVPPPAPAEGGASAPAGR